MKDGKDALKKVEEANKEIGKLSGEFKNKLKGKIQKAEKKKHDYENPALAVYMFQEAEKHIAAANGIKFSMDSFKQYVGILKESISNVNKAAAQKLDGAIKLHGDAFFSQPIYKS